MEILNKNQIDYSDCFIILFLALLTNVFSELLSFLLIYRTKRYKELKKLIDSTTKKVDTSKESLRGKSKTSDKKLKQLEGDLKTYNMEMVKVIFFVI